MSISCSNKNEKKIKYHKLNIDFLNATIELPENYNLITLDEFGEILGQSELDSVIIEKRLKGISEMKNKDTPFIMFCDNNNIENNIFITPSFNMYINKNTVREVGVYITNYMKAREQNENLLYSRIENRFYEDSEMIKIKGKLTRYNNSDTFIYNTFYVTYRFTAFVNNYESYDFEKELKNIKYN